MDILSEHSLNLLTHDVPLSNRFQDGCVILWPGYLQGVSTYCNLTDLQTVYLGAAGNKPLKPPGSYVVPQLLLRTKLLLGQCIQGDGSGDQWQPP